ncbi:AMP-binding protein [Mycolicibacterium sp. BiH015]|uniref:AMP-binding protein n=1 Tax=Mycolicibacterium sp. BiH015 TaxID=3018808 RepID=UPI0022E63513|nr:AMP-binding protein [Mycolicibacterium sp. BiH015]MDA2895201.1 AMP-binding protein [Mycolicibacterium sp. BiH015]
MSTGKPFLPAQLRERASLQPDDTAFTFIDYEQSWDGVAESLTWPQLYRRVRNLAVELRRRASPGDRAVISAPQGLDYVVGFLAALEAGLIAVPLSVPFGGVTDARFDSVLQDSAPAVVLTTSAVAGAVTMHVACQPGGSSGSVIEVDLLDLDTPVRSTNADEYHEIAYLQYTSGSTREPAGVVITHTNLKVNFDQLMRGYFPRTGGVGPHDMTVASWLPFYHDLGLLLGICAPLIVDSPAALISPVAFLQRPARWMQLLATGTSVFSAAPNFAFDLAARKTSDEDMAGLDLGGVSRIVSGAERVQPATLKRFAERFARFNLDSSALQPAYGLAEATLYVATCDADRPPQIVAFDSEKLVAGRAMRCDTGGTPLVSYPTLESPAVRIVDPETRTECAEGATGEIWVHGDNVGDGYWRRPEETRHTFQARLVEPSAGTPEGPWLRTGDLGFLSEQTLFIVGRIKDLLIVYGQNHAPDDIEATISELTRGRVAAIAVPEYGAEKLVAVIELKTSGDSPTELMDRVTAIKREVTSAILNSHGIGVADLVLVPPGSIPITTSGKIRRSACIDLYRQHLFVRLDTFDPSGIPADS